MFELVGCSAMETVRPLTATLLVLKVCPFGSGYGPMAVQVGVLEEALAETCAPASAPSVAVPVRGASTVLVALSGLPSCRFISRMALPRAPGSKGRPGATPRN